MWDGAEHVDPMREAKAQATRLNSLTTTLAPEYAKQGKDWEVELRQAAQERKLLITLGLVNAPVPDTPNEEDKNGQKTSNAPQTQAAESRSAGG
jgi:capsid protein